MIMDRIHDTVSALAAALDRKDGYTGGHIRRVAHYAEAIALCMGLGEEEVLEARLSAVLHDVGKIGIDCQVLTKAGPLDELEWEQMKSHPDLGWMILAHVQGLSRVAEVIRSHHERPDGLGYPLKLKGEQIPLAARIIAVADAFDAMTSDRPYRKALSAEQALKEIVRCRGTQFDEKVVDGFVRAFKLEGWAKRATTTNKRLNLETPYSRR